MAESSLCWIYTIIIFCSVPGTAHGYFEHWYRQCLYKRADQQLREYIETTYINKVEMIKFNSTLNEYVGLTPLGLEWAKVYNNDHTHIPEAWDRMNNLCDQDYQYNTVNKTVKPRVQMKLLKDSEWSNSAILMCSAYDFYPKAIRVYWLRDGKAVTSDVMSTEELSDGDWYHQLHTHLQYTPNTGEKISCVVEHAGFEKPLQYDWDPAFSDRNKIIVGTVGFGMGLIVASAGLIFYKRRTGIEDEEMTSETSSTSDNQPDSHSIVMRLRSRH